MMTGRGEPQAVGCAGYRSWELIQCLNQVDLTTPHLCDVGGGPQEFFPGCTYGVTFPIGGGIVGAMISECMFRPVIGPHACNRMNFLFGVFKS